MSPEKFNALDARFLLAGLVFLFGTMVADVVNGAPYTPDDDNLVLVETGRSGSSSDGLNVRVALREANRSRDTALLTSRKFLEHYRQSGEIRYLGYADSIVLRWMRPSDAEFIFLRARIQQSRHQYRDALVSLSRMIRLRPRHFDAWITKAVIEQVTGDYVQASASCQIAARIKSNIMSQACVLSVKSVTGSLEHAANELGQLLAWRDASQDAGHLWALGEYAHMLRRLGRSELALKQYEKILQVSTDSIVAWRGIAEVLQESDLSCETYPALLARNDMALRVHQGIACSSGVTVNAVKSKTKVRQLLLREDGEIQQSAHLLDFAKAWLYVLRQPKKALEYAQLNFETQKSPDDLIVLLDAALQQDDSQLIAEALAYRDHYQFEDARVEALMHKWRNHD